MSSSNRNKKQDQLANILGRARNAQAAQKEEPEESKAPPIAEAKTDRPVAKRAVPPKKKTTPKPAPKRKAGAPKKKAAPRPAPEPVEETPKKKVSKRSDPNYRALTLFLTKETDHGIDDAILKAKRAGTPIGDRSDVAEMAIKAWLEANG